MGAQFFKFKKFTIHHDLCAMKAGTDAVLLGSWCTVCRHSRILDIGTGSGIIALMLAQREENSTITAIDNDVNAIKQAFINVNNSIFKENIEVREADFRTFAQETENESYDSIVSNPPILRGRGILARQEQKRGKTHIVPPFCRTHTRLGHPTETSRDFQSDCALHCSQNRHRAGRS